MDRERSRKRNKSRPSKRFFSVGLDVGVFEGAIEVGALVVGDLDGAFDVGTGVVGVLEGAREVGALDGGELVGVLVGAGDTGLHRLSVTNTMRSSTFHVVAILMYLDGGDEVIGK
jgi:hypothetical protein